MNFVKKFFRILWRDHRDGLWFLFFPVFGIYYFFIQHIGLEYRVIHVSLDDKIPFVPAFVIPYILWYLYIPATLCYVWLKDKRGFRKQLWCLYPGMILCYVLFVLFPTTVDFRPADPGSGFFAFLCRIIYSADNPVNVFPSLHCYEAVVAHLTTFTRGPLRHTSPCGFLLPFLRCSSACPRFLSNSIRFWMWPPERFWRCCPLSCAASSSGERKEEKRRQVRRSIEPMRTQFLPAWRAFPPGLGKKAGKGFLRRMQKRSRKAGNNGKYAGATARFLF